MSFKLIFLSVLVFLSFNLAAFADNLQLMIKTDKKTYKIDEPIIIDYEIKNLGKSDVKIYIPFAGIIDRPIGFYVRKNDWKEKEAIFAVVDYYPGYGEGKVFDLKPGNVYAQKWNIVDFDYFGKKAQYGWDHNKQGSYEITAQYDLSEPMAKNLCFRQYCSTEKLISNTISVDVN